MQPVDNQEKSVASSNENKKESAGNINATGLQLVDNCTNLGFYKKQVELLQDELKIEREHSRQQADRIADLAEKLTELTRNSQVLLKQEQEKNTLLLTEPVTDAEEAHSSEPTGQNQKIKKRPSWQFWKK